jgi:hypothetical protein
MMAAVFFAVATAVIGGCYLAMRRLGRINTPERPWEACGTSGMKVLVNGGVNLSTRDGWWAEAYRPEVGWVLEGDGWDDASDAARLYDPRESGAGVSSRALTEQAPRAPSRASDVPGTWRSAPAGRRDGTLAVGLDGAPDYRVHRGPDRERR